MYFFGKKLFWLSALAISLFFLMDAQAVKAADFCCFNFATDNSFVSSKVTAADSAAAIASFEKSGGSIFPGYSFAVPYVNTFGDCKKQRDSIKNTNSGTLCTGFKGTCQTDKSGGLELANGDDCGNGKYCIVKGLEMSGKTVVQSKDAYYCYGVGSSLTGYYGYVAVLKGAAPPSDAACEAKLKENAGWTPIPGMSKIYTAGGIISCSTKAECDTASSKFFDQNKAAICGSLGGSCVPEASEQTGGMKASGFCASGQKCWFGNLSVGSAGLPCITGGNCTYTTTPPDGDKPPSDNGGTGTGTTGSGSGSGNTPAAGNTNGDTLFNPLANSGINMDKPVASLAAKAINLMFGISGSIALVMFVYGGFRWLISAGNSKGVEAGKQAFIWASFGLMMMFSSYIVVRYAFGNLLGNVVPGAGDMAQKLGTFNNPKPATPTGTTQCSVAGIVGSKLGSCADYTVCLVFKDKKPQSCELAKKGDFIYQSIDNQCSWPATDSKSGLSCIDAKNGTTSTSGGTAPGPAISQQSPAPASGFKCYTCYGGNISENGATTAGECKTNGGAFVGTMDDLPSWTCKLLSLSMKNGETCAGQMLPVNEEYDEAMCVFQ